MKKHRYPKLNVVKDIYKRLIRLKPDNSFQQPCFMYDKKLNLILMQLLEHGTARKKRSIRNQARILVAQWRRALLSNPRTRNSLLNSLYVDMIATNALAAEILVIFDQYIIFTPNNLHQAPATLLNYLKQHYAFEEIPTRRNKVVPPVNDPPNEDSELPNVIEDQANVNRNTKLEKILQLYRPKGLM